MRKFLTYLLIFCFAAAGHSQVNRAKNWQFGTNNGLSFAGGSPTLVTGGMLTNTLGCASISDLSGNLLFYTDGVTIYNSTNVVMANGTGLDGTGASQPAIILKQPGNSNIYYLFTVGGSTTTNGLKYSVVDMSLAGGQGSVTIKNIVIDNSCRDKLTAGKHCNGSDLWVVSTSTNINNYFSYCSAPLSPTGIGIPVQGTITNAYAFYNFLGQIKLSPNSRKIGFVGFQPITSSGHMTRMIADFDNATGQITLNNNQIPYYWSITHNAFTQANIYGIEFSPNTQYVYCNTIYQAVNKIGLCDSSETYVPIQETTNQFDFYGNKCQYQLAPDGRIYIARSGTTVIGAINNPGGTSATYTQVGLSLGTNTCQWGLPNFPGFYFEQKPPLAFTYTSNVSCMTASFSTTPPCSRTGYVVSGYNWDFGDLPSGTNNISFLQNPFHTFTSAGTYTVRLIRYLQCNTADTVVQTVNITQPVLSINSSTTCYGTTSTVQVIGGAGPYSYLWSANTQTNSIANFTTAGVYSVTVSDQGAGNCQRTATVAITVPTIIVSVAISPSVVCFGANNAQATVNVSGGSGSYMYSYAQNMQSTSVFGNLSAGNHTINITDVGFSCVHTKTFAIASAAPVVVLSAATPTQICAGSNMNLVAYASGGTGIYTYVWQPSSAQGSSMVIAPTAGSYVYTVIATDNMGCTGTSTLGFAVSPAPTISISNASACIGTQINLAATGANTYTWQPGNLISNTITQTASANIVYTVTGASSYGCINTNTAMLSVILPATVIASCNSPLCEGQSVNFSAGAINAYQWQGPNSFLSNQQNPQINNALPLSSGNYTLTTTDANGCKSKTVINLLVNALPQVSLLTYTNTICQGQQLSISAFGANTYTWMNGLNVTPLPITPLSNTVIQVTGTDAQTGCVASASLAITVKKCNAAGIIQSNSENNGFQIYPNPSQGDFLIQSPGLARYTIVDALGRKIMEGELKAGTNEIKLMTPLKGQYFVKLYYMNQEFVQKLIIE